MGEDGRERTRDREVQLPNVLSLRMLQPSGWRPEHMGCRAGRKPQCKAVAGASPRWSLCGRSEVGNTAPLAFPFLPRALQPPVVTAGSAGNRAERRMTGRGGRETSTATCSQPAEMTTSLGFLGCRAVLPKASPCEMRGRHMRSPGNTRGLKWVGGHRGWHGRRGSALCCNHTRIAKLKGPPRISSTWYRF